MKREVLTKAAAGCALLGMLGAAGFGTMAVQAETSKNQAPVLSGTNYVQVLKGDVFEEKDVLNRVYAMDYEDGDLTQEIRLVSNDVNTDEEGAYSVVYEVVDSKGAKDTFTTIVQVVDSYNEFGKYIQKTLYTKEDAKHLLDVELYRGYYHDRQHLGIYLNAGSTLYVRLVNWEEVWSADLYMDIFCDDSVLEKEYNIPWDGSWLAIPAEDVTEGMVPFVRTLKSDVEPILEYYYLEGEMEELTYYSYGDDETAFFDTWNGNDQQYAVLDGERVTMLIPRRDKDSILNNSTTREEYRFKTLDGMLDYFKALQDQYDEYAGLVWDTDAGIDKNIRAKYFVKADATGVGAAYYNGGLYTAENSESINGYLKRDWMTMHEVAHGYDSSLAYGNVPLVECINNMFGYFYEKGTLAQDDTGWSSMQYLELVEQRYMDQIADGKIFTSMDFDARLYCMVNALTFGDAKEMMADLYHAWRVDKGKSVTSDFLVEQFSDTTGYNLVPYFEEYGLEISELVKSRIYEKNYPIANRFAYHFADQTAASDAKQTVGDTVNGLYGLAASEELAVLGCKGNLNVTIQIDDLAQIKGKEIRLMDGTKEIASVKVESEKAVFSNLPIGTYCMELPAAEAPGYYTEYTYVVICDGKPADVDAVYHKNTDNEMCDDAAIVLQGLSDKVFSTISTNVSEGTVTVTTENVQPHYIFNQPSEPYAVVVVESADGKQLYSRSYIGSEEYEYQTETINAPVGSKVYVTHQEIGGGNIAERRVQVKSRVLAAIIPEYMADYETKDYTVVFEVTENGLKRADWDQASFDAARTKTADELLAFMEQNEGVTQNKGAYQRTKALVFGLVSTFDETLQESYRQNYPYIFGEDAAVVVNPFTDVSEQDYFYEPVLWALDTKVTSGYSATIFAPNKTCTRAEVVTFLWRANGNPKPQNQDNPFVDVSKDVYYYDAVLWAVEQGITAGYTPQQFAPNDTVTRAQVACFLWRAAGQPSYTTANPFSDIVGNAYYTDAVLWAYENKITAGYKADQFAPEMGCTRCQVVSFLYRAK